jgi:tyrosine-protein kinase Etk/Wzc
MSPSLPPQEPELERQPVPDLFAQQARGPGKAEETDLGEWLANFWEGRYLILGCLLVSLAAGALSAWRAVPVYQIEAMLQVQDKKERSTDPAFTKMEGLFSEPSDALAEVEILKSNLVLGRTVESLSLDIVAAPVFMPIVGAALMRNKPNPPAIGIQSFEVPPLLMGKKFLLTVLGDGSFQWSTWNGEALATGRPGVPVQAIYDGQTMRLHVNSLTGQPGQKFVVIRQPLQAAIASLRLNFDAEEKGKGTGVIGLTLKSPSQTLGTATLNQIVDQYIRHKLEKKGGDAAQTLALLQEKMPLLKARLDESESRLNQFRSQSGSVDLPREAEGLVTQSAALNGEISSLKQKREELLRTYKEGADVVVTTNAQIAKLQAEVNQLDTRIRVLPGTEQTIMRLTRDVTVNQELYTALLNNIQQLQVSKGGDVGAYDLVDPATPNMVPMGATPTMQIALSGFLGLLVGAALARMRRLLRMGVKDHRLIESKLGLPVLVTVPHSLAQDKLAKRVGKHQEGVHILALLDPNDLATESLRSLRTVMHFALKDAPNRVVLVTGPAPLIGKSFISTNYAALLAQSGAKVLLIDGDLRKGNLHHFFGLKKRHPGFAEVLAQRLALETAVQKTGIPGLDLLTTGLLPSNPSELLMSDRLPDLLNKALAAYQFVILDAPPLLAVTDATIMGAKAGTVLLVVKYGQHPLDELRTCQRRLDAAGVHLLGCIFNNVQPSGLGYLGRSYTYDYHYTYKS